MSAKDFYPDSMTPADFSYVNGDTEPTDGEWVEVPVSLRVYMEHDESSHTAEFAFEKFLNVSESRDDASYVLEDVEPDYVERLRKTIQRLEIEIESKDAELRARALHIAKLQREKAA